ncbi:monovalent cation:proton antiporter-2 (CPA2) family protein [Draconibacterium sp. IB214405]|uniref:monovalent cation:proton antiporter-2 (CPA2) family protein n=1 Tax=Draconibacterium sp. IB214405 TaxID=3097352 RepID=UPI002A0F7E96|nr:monovalent cation:proton antiporter-2 (CPA2) family protein [Draconibacterium sp. IB214405]MDX8339139.1 monovalent cation:proton antiporter-2 (CPA2) family protein [Draconibacterium sp. IB214405]
MHNQEFFLNALIYLGAAVVSVPIAKKLGLGSVLGYLLAGIIIGPFVLKLVGTEAGEVMHFAEFGVVLMLFIIGLELEPKLLWKMRRSIFGLGGLQVLITAGIITGVSLLLNFQLNRAVAIGLILALSSTAIVLQTLSEKGLMRNIAGRSAFSVLLFQDMAVIPILALLPIIATLGAPADLSDTSLNNIGQVAQMPGWLQLLIIIGAITVLVIIGRFAARHIFRLVAETGLREVFVALALLMVIGIALGMDAIGLSPALGTFIAGVVLADSEYRHELETTIDPFKGLLLGLFFISVGASINFNLLIEDPWVIILFVFLLIFIKFVVLLILGRMFRLKKGFEFLFAFLLAQASEFAFVLISFSKQNKLFDEQTSGMLLLVVTLSMAISPLLLIFNDKAVSPILARWQNKLEYDEIEPEENPVILAGFGRFGLTVGRILLANGFKVTILDNNPSNVETLRKYGFKLYFGDITRPTMLEKAGIENARLLILSMAEHENALKVAEIVRKKYSHVKILARAKDIFHVFEYLNLNISDVERENFHSASELGNRALVELGFSKYEAYRATRTFKHHEDQVTDELYQHWLEDQNKFIQETRRFEEQVKETLQAEKNYSIHETDCAWDVDSLKNEAKKEK